jgi:carbon-monoxide dehydrogenase large subunit
MVDRFIGTSVRRVEDPRLLTGRGQFVDDVAVPGMLEAAFVRSPHPHARIAGIDTGAAAALPGVVAVITGDDLAGTVRPMRQQGPAGLRTPEFFALARDKVRCVGDPVAIVVADSRYRAEDGADLVEVEYDPLPPVPDATTALGPGAPLLYDELGDNIAYSDRWDYGDVGAAFAAADRVVRETFRQHRHANVPMETRGGLAAFAPATGQLVYYASHKAPHALRHQLALLLDHPEHRINVICGDVGGAFGQKGPTSREDVALCAAARSLGRPVKWIEDRVENLTNGGQAREDTLEVEAAVRGDGTILGLKVRMTMDQGAYPGLPIPISMFPSLVRLLLPGAYRIRDYSFESVVAFTNKDHYVSYRGPWAVETWARERLFDLVARDLGIDRVEIRHRNLLGDDEFPTELCTGPTLQGTTVRQTLERAAERIGWRSFGEVQRQARAEGRYLGLGLASFIEIAPGPPNFAAMAGFDLQTERARARLEPDGHLVIFTSQAPHGQGHETTLAQVAADELGVPLDAVRVVHGDTMLTPFSPVGTGGSRASTMGSGAALGATRMVKQQVLRIASSLLEAAEEDLEIVDGHVLVRGVPSRGIRLEQVATVAYLTPGSLPAGMPPGIEATFDFRIPEGGWAQATHSCIVEVALDTGEVRILRYLVVEDCGTMINPAVVEGQVRGGVAQGIGGVLYERSAYDGDAQFLAGTFMDYLVPTAVEIPAIEIDHVESDPTHEVNYRGVGEGGAIGAPAALSSAIEDALSPLGVRITEQYLPPARILELAGVVPTGRHDAAVKGAWRPPGAAAPAGGAPG